MAATHRAMILAKYGSLEAYRDYLNEVLDDLHLTFAERVQMYSLELKDDARPYEVALKWTEDAIGRRDRSK